MFIIDMALTPSQNVGAGMLDPDTIYRMHPELGPQNDANDEEVPWRDIPDLPAGPEMPPPGPCDDVPGISPNNQDHWYLFS